MSCAKRKLSQNILLAAYKEPLTIEQLCMELGTPAAYIEDEVENLVSNQLMKEVSAGKYQTDFVILPGHNTDLAHKLYNACFPGYYNALMAFLEEHKELLSAGRFNTANFSWDRLLWVYLHMFTDFVGSKFRYEESKVVKYQDIPERPKGGKWIALGFNDSWPSDRKEQEVRWKEYVPFDGPVHKVNKAFAQGYFHYWSGLDSHVFFEISDDVFALCQEIIKGNLSVQSLSEEQKYLFSIALEKKLFLREKDVFRQNYYYVAWDEMQHLKQLALTFYPTALEFFQRAYKMILAEYQSSIPKHLHWQMGNFLSNSLGIFVTGSLYEGMGNHVLSAPDENNRDWLSLFASEQFSS